MDLIVLAGGFGTRLKSITKDTPKPMVQINNLPFIKLVIDNVISKIDIDKIILSLCYKPYVFIKYFKNEYRQKKIEYSIEDIPLGTGGGIKKSLSLAKSDIIIAINGDTYFDVDYQRMIRNHLDRKAILTIALKKKHKFNRYGTVLFDQKNNVVGFKEKKPCEKGHINGGIYILSKEIFKIKNTKGNFSFEKYIERIIFKTKINAYISEGFFIDIGIPEDYHRAIEHFSNPLKIKN